MSDVADRYPDSFRYVFHHLPKCGGNSINEVVKQWFEQVRDYRPGYAVEYPEPVDITNLDFQHCLCGHWELKGYYLQERYPEVFESDQYRVFTFVRDPLNTKLSLYRYEKDKNIGHKYPSVVGSILSRPNWLSKRFPVTEENYQAILDRYYFIGILEDGQMALDILAHMLDKPKLTIPHANRTVISEDSIITDEVMEEFKELNALDYLVYEYCRKKYLDLKLRYLTRQPA